MANIEVETIGSSLLKKFNATGSVWENDPWVHQILLPGRDDCSFFEAGDLEFAERPVSLYAFGKNLEGAPFNAIMADEYISKLKKTLELIEEHSPLGLEHFDHIIYSAEQIINGYTKTPANAVYLQDFERYTPEKPFGSLNDTAVLFPAVLSSGAFRGEISEMTHFEGVIGHEQSHRFQDIYHDGKFAARYQSIFQSEGGLTTYGQSHYTEDFSEACSLYLLAPDFLRDKSPARFDFIDQFMKRKEFELNNTPASSEQIK